MVELAAEALATCEGPKPARHLLDDVLTTEQAGPSLNRVLDELTAAGQVAAARALAPAPDPSDAEQLLAAAQRLQKQRDFPAARLMAIQASEVALKVSRDPAQPVWKWLDHTALLGRIFSVLTAAGAYDEALATVQPIEMINRQQFYLAAIDAEAQHKDAAAIRKTLPASIEAVTASEPGANAAQNYLCRMTVSLARAGFRNAAEVPFKAMTATASGWAFPTPDPALARFAQAQAAMGDIAGALATAEHAGPLVASRTVPEKQFLASLAMVMSADSKTSLMSRQAATREQQLAASVPTVHPGPKASVLAAITTKLATEGNGAAALQAESGLESDPRDVLQGLRDDALAAIANAQLEAGDPVEAFNTAMRIDQKLVRWGPLLRLAALPPTP